MANSISGFFQTLAAQSTEACGSLIGNTAMLDAVYTEFRPVVASPHQTVTVNIAPTLTYGTSQQVDDLGVGGLTPIDATFDPKPLTYSLHPGVSWIIRDFEQFRSAEAIRQMLVEPAIYGTASYINQKLCALATAANFNVHTPISGGANVFTSTHLKDSRAALANAKVNVKDSRNMSFLTTSDAYHNMLNESSLTQESNVGLLITDPAKRSAALGQQYGFNVDFDQDFPTLSSGASHVALAFHRHAISLVTAYLPEPGSNTVEVHYAIYKNIPIRIMLSYDHLSLGYVLSADAVYALGVTRPNHGVLLVSA